jgi:hypothetical protein
MLAMLFVSPAFFAAGALLAAVPILIHILNRRRFKEVQWAAMDFLLRAMRRNRRRLRFEQLLLLATRCALLLLLGIALARPLGCQSNSLAQMAATRTGLHVLVIDNSYPMAYETNRQGDQTHLDRAKSIAREILSRLSSGGESVAIVTASRPAKAIIAQPTYDLRAAAAAIDRIEQSYTGADESAALVLARDIGAAASDQPNKNLYLIDDSRRIAWEENSDAVLQTGHQLAGIYKAGITHFDVGTPGQWNDAVVDLKPAEPLVTDRFAADFVADARGFGPGAGEAKIAWTLDGQPMPAAASVASPAAAAAPITFTIPSLSGGIHIISASASAGDPLKIDDPRSRVVSVVSQLKVLIVEGERGVGGLGSSGAFLDTALNPTGAEGAKSDSYIATERISDLELPNKVLSDYRCICLCGVGEIQEDVAANLEKFVRAGGTLMIFMGDPVTAENYNATLYKHHLLPGPLSRKITVGADAPPAHFAVDPNGLLHPLLEDFRGHEDTGMEAAEIYTYWQIDLPQNSKAERVLDFRSPADSKNIPPDPAITLDTLGAGRVVFYATSADPSSEWTTFMAHQAYPALMHMLVLGTVGGGDEWMNISVGQSVTIPAGVKLTAAPILRDSEQAEYPIQQTADDQGQTVYRSAPIKSPGIYTLTTGTDTFKVAVNLPSDDADVRQIDDNSLKKSLGDIDIRMEGDSLPATAEQVEPEKDLGWSVMLGVLVLAASECFMAMRFGHHRKT